MVGGFGILLKIFLYYHGFLPTALLHSVKVTEKRDGLKSWTILLSILIFFINLLGTFIVRSGLLTSVHAFASDPARGFLF